MIALEAAIEPELVGARVRARVRPAAPSRRSPARFTRRSLRSVEGEDRDVDLHHHRPQQARGLERAEPLVVQRVGEHVDLEHHRAERVVAAAPRARMEKSLSRSAASRFDSVCSGSTTRSRRTPAIAEPQAHDDERQRPLDLGGVVAGPEQDERDDGAGNASGQREQQDAPVVSQPAFERGRIRRIG